MPKDTHESVKPIQKKSHLFDSQPVEFTKPADFVPTSDGVAAFYESVKPGTMRRREPLPRKASAKPSARPKKSSTGQQPSGADQSRYNRNKSVPKGHPKERLESNRQSNREIADLLESRAQGYDDQFYRIARKIDNCSMHGAFLELSPTVANKIGQAMCKHRGCPTCQRILAVKRRAAIDAFLTENFELVKGYKFYHLVLTVRHSNEADIRTHFYLPDLLDYFKQLRGVTGGKITDQRAWWDKRVAGGFYSVEATPSKDGTAHIHLHIILLAKMPLYRHGQSSEFLKAVKIKWLELTGALDVNAASTQVYIEPVYTYKKDEDGKPLLDAKGERIKHYATAANLGAEHYAEHLQAAITECAKYTMKTDAQSLNSFSDAMLRDLLTLRHRYYGRFGILHAKHPDAKRWKNLNRLNADFKDLTELDAKKAKQLWNPETEQVVDRKDCKLSITPFRNTAAKQAGGSIHLDEDGKQRGGEVYWSILDRTRVTEFPTEYHMPKALSLTIYREYVPADDLLPPAHGDEAAAPSAPDPEPTEPGISLFDIRLPMNAFRKNPTLNQFENEEFERSSGASRPIAN